MGLSTRELRRMGVKIPGRDLGGHFQPELDLPAPAYFWFRIGITPPTVTHHDKVIAPRTQKGGKLIRTLVDSDRLVAARQAYEFAIPHRGHRPIPLAPPIVLWVTFAWPRPAGVEQLHHTVKPDCSNAIKLLEDVLTVRGYWVGDELVSDLHVEKRWTDGPGWISVYARSLAGPNDPGNLMHPMPGDRPFIVHPAPWLLAQDANQVPASSKSAAEVIALTIGTPGGGPRTDEGARRRGHPRAKTVSLPPTRNGPAAQRQRAASEPAETTRGVGGSRKPGPQNRSGKGKGAQP